eukprot:GEZU01035654.1.p1 GENE.GEZU01035654.1~~GEZU01035654.1.p1  ORF type:complete len:285 (+),score=102.92 GEZU01035654.1:192-1046(+)
MIMSSSSKEAHTASERAKFEAHRMEEVARKEQQAAGAGGQTLIGGFHSVSLELTEKAKSELQKLKSERAEWIQFQIVGGGIVGGGGGGGGGVGGEMMIDAVEVKESIQLSSLSALINDKEPRYYVCSVVSRGSGSGGGGGGGGKRNVVVVFIYCCPEKSEKKLRMVYSTAKSSITKYIKDTLGITVANTLEISTPAELASSDIVTNKAIVNVAAASKNGNAPFGKHMLRPSEGAGDGTVKASNLPTVSAEHPVYAMIHQGNNNNNSSASTKMKKIVMPPPAAYM